MTLVPTEAYWPTTRVRLVTNPLTGARTTVRSRLSCAVERSATACWWLAAAEAALSLASSRAPRLAPLNLTFEAWLYHSQLMELVDLARAFPQTTIILNHVGGPLGIGPYADKRQETFAVWKAGIAEVGGCQNVVVKLGGLGMLFGMFDFHTRETPPSSEELARAYQPYIETCIVAFGLDRGMFESNFPPEGVSSSYAVLWNAFRRPGRGYSADERRSCSAARSSAFTVSPRSRWRLSLPSGRDSRHESGLPVRREMPGRRRAARPTWVTVALPPVTWSPRAPNGGKRCGRYELPRLQIPKG